MDKNLKIAKHFNGLYRCLIYFLLAAVIYLAILFKFSRSIYSDKVGLYLMGIHYLLMLSLIVVFIVLIAVSVYAYCKLLYEAKVIKFKPALVLAGYLLIIAAAGSVFILPTPFELFLTLPLQVLIYLTFIKIPGDKYFRGLQP